MNPICATVENASARFTVGCVSMTIAPKTADSVPASASNARAGPASTISGLSRMMRNPPALMIPACMNAETGVGVSMVSGSQPWKGNCADFSSAQPARSIPMGVNPEPAPDSSRAKIASISQVPK